MSKNDTNPTQKVNFDLVFGGFKQYPIEKESSKKKKIVKGKRRYPAEVGKLCKNVFSDKDDEK